MSTHRRRATILELQDICAESPTEVPLRSVNLKIRSGEIHTLVGDENSGKTSLVKLLSGTLQPSGGRILFNGKEVDISGPNKAKALGIETIYKQSRTFAEESVYESLFVGRWPGPTFIVSRRQMRSKALEVLHTFFPDRSFDLDEPTKNLSENVRGILDVAGSFCRPVQLFVVEELSKRLEGSQIETAKYLLAQHRQNGASVFLVSNSIQEIYNFSDRISVMSRGRIVRTRKVAGFEKLQLVHLLYSYLYDPKVLKRDDFELNYLQNFNESLIDAIPFPFLVIDRRGNVILVNRRLAELLDLKPRQCVNRSFADLLGLHDPHLQSVKSALAACETRTFYSVDTSVSRKSGPVVLSLLPVHDRDGAFLGTIFFFDLIFDYAHLETKIGDNRSFGRSSESIARVAHEMRNPLAIIGNYTKILKSCADGAQIRENAERIEKELKRLTDNVNSVLSDVQAHNEKNRRQLQVAAFLHGIAALLGQALSEKRVQLDILLKADGVLNVEAEHFKHIMLNLITNSIESMPDGGAIRISDSFIELNGGRYYMIDVSDNGKGIPEKDLPHIFEPFYSTKKTKEIRGLGLSICRDLLSRYEGLIRAESAVDHGSTFHVLFPESRLVCQS
jgi:signal transduction histidine kinase/ABC-type transport system involved in cytochrome c biogenesis ATPase subunit